MTPPLQGLTAVVTGAGRGLGRAEALELARLGASVVVDDYGRPGRDGTGDASAGPAAQVVAEIRDSLGGTAVAHTGDVADFRQARDLVQPAIGTFGKLVRPPQGALQHHPRRRASTRSPRSMSPRSSATWPHRPPPGETFAAAEVLGLGRG